MKFKAALFSEVSVSDPFLSFATRPARCLVKFFFQIKPQWAPRFSPDMNSHHTFDIQIQIIIDDLMCRMIKSLENCPKINKNLFFARIYVFIKTQTSLKCSKYFSFCPRVQVFLNEKYEKCAPDKVINLTSRHKLHECITLLRRFVRRATVWRFKTSNYFKNEHKSSSFDPKLLKKFK